MATGGARFTIVTSEKWEDDWYLSLPPQTRNLFDFLCEGSHGTYAGLFKVSHTTIKQKTGPWTRERYERALGALAGHVLFHHPNWVFVVHYLRYNGPSEGGNLSENQAKGVTAIASFAPLPLRAAFWGEYEALLKPHGIRLETLSIPLDYPFESRVRAPAIPDHSIPGHSKKGNSMEASPPCVLCAYREGYPRPPEAGYRPKWRAQAYHDLGKEKLGVSCVALGMRERNLLSRAAKKYGEVTLWVWWREFLSKPCKIGHSLAVFCSNAVLESFAEKKAEKVQREDDDRKRRAASRETERRMGGEA